MAKKKNIAGIWVGAHKETVREARKAIMKIVGAKCDESTKVAALNAFTDSVSVKQTTLTGCTIEGPLER
jgi:hypothetical protein